MYFFKIIYVKYFLMSHFFFFSDIAAYIKKEFDKKYNPTWHCIVGRNFGSYVTHETRHFIYFYLGQVLIFFVKSTVCLLLLCEISFMFTFFVKSPYIFSLFYFPGCHSPFQERLINNYLWNF